MEEEEEEEGDEEEEEEEGEEGEKRKGRGVRRMREGRDERRVGAIRSKTHAVEGEKGEGSKPAWFSAPDEDFPPADKRSTAGRG
ncbi:hypothetical protein CRUP_031235 [Coryphaenoides rupestris]|nr:hypothetical protein CRUP_031235 [Coryphaenoides rupestris]